jgi:fatty-acyl-CoA synthase
MSAAGPTLVSVLTERAAREPERVFCTVVAGGRETELTYGEILSSGCRFAALYAERGASVGDTVGIVLHTGPAQVLAFLGAILGGFVPSFAAPLGDRQDPVHYWTQLRLQLHRLRRGLLLVDPALAEHIRRECGELDVPLVTLASLDDLPTSGCAVRSPRPDDIALLQHSSGTTGSLKGVALGHRAVLEQTESYQRSLALRPDDVIVSWLPLYHDMGLISSFVLPLVTGVRLVLLDPFEWVAAPWTLLERIEQHRGTLTWLPNFAFHLLARASQTRPRLPRLSSMRAFINCSEPCKPEAFEVFLERFAEAGVTRDKLQVCYAMAEAVFAVTQTALGEPVVPLAASRAGLQLGRLAPPAADDLTYLVPVGRPIERVSVRIADEHGPVPDGQVGEVQVQASFAFSGYFDEPELTAAATCGPYYRTGDLGFMYEGALYITGRLKDVLIVNGRNFYAHDIEAIVTEVAGVKAGRVVAVGLPTPLGSEAACVLAESEAPPAEYGELGRRIKAAVLAHLGLVLSRVVVVPPRSLIKTTSGKVSRSANRERLLSHMPMETK